MFGIRVLALVAACFFAGPAEGIRHRRKGSQVTKVPEASFNCSVLGNIVVRDHNFGDLAELVCKAWPPALGSFPIDSGSKIVELLEVVFGPDGAWEEMQAIWKARRDKRFCWRNETRRDIVPLSSNYECQMEMDDVCYGHCPRGYKPGALLGRFRPICTSICADTFHQIPCGFGCADTRFACFQTIFDQVTTVAGEVARVIGAITGNPAIEVVVDTILSIAEFALEVLPKILRAIRNVMKWTERGYKEVGFFLVLFQFVAEVWPTNPGDREAIEELHRTIANVMQYILDLTDGHLGSIIDLSKLRDIILNHGDDIMGSIRTVIQAFNYPKCGEMERNTMFTIEDVGEEAVVGPWVQYYETNQRPRYALVTNQDYLMEYTRRRKAWQMLTPGDWLGRRDTLYLADADTSDYPRTGWVADKGALPAPEPLPAVFTCNALETMRVNGHGFGRVAGLICHFWPSSLGQFPLQSEQVAFDILEKAFHSGGLWDQIAEIRASRRDQPGFCWRDETLRVVLPAGSRCEMEHNGVCYGSCPWGFKKSMLTGSFAPVCTSACGESEFGFPCGFGCASNLGKCLDNVKTQVGEVTRFLGDAAGFIFDNVVVSDVVERITYIVEFVVDVLPVFVEKAKEFWRGVQEDQAEAALLIVLVQYIFEGSEGQQENEALRELVGEVLEFVQELVHANWDWEKVDFTFIKEKFVQYGDKALKAMATLGEDFLYRRCEAAESSVKFSVDSAGDEDLLGLWILNGTNNGRPKYNLRGDTKQRLEWTGSRWEFLGPFLHFWDETLYTSDVASSLPPMTGWVVKDGPAPIPELIFLNGYAKPAGL